MVRSEGSSHAPAHTQSCEVAGLSFCCADTSVLKLGILQRGSARAGLPHLGPWTLGSSVGLASAAFGSAVASLGFVHFSQKNH